MYYLPRTNVVSSRGHYTNPAKINVIIIINMKSSKLFFLMTTLLLAVFLLWPKVSLAFDEPLKINFSMDTVQRGYTADYRNKDFVLGLNPDFINEEATLRMTQFNGSQMPMPQNLQLASDFFVFDVLSKNGSGPLKLNKSLSLAIRFNSDNYYKKSIYFWDGNRQEWRLLPSTTDYDGKYARASIGLPYAQVAVFEDPKILEGMASWYRSSKYPYGATCNNYPADTKLRVTNIENKKSVIVKVVPGKMTHSTRVIDLSLTAFKKIAVSSEGLARVRVEPVSQVVLGAETNKSNAPAIKSKAAVAINEKTGEIIFGKNENDILPMASLTKIMTAAIFLERNIPMETVVTYRAEDNADGSRLYISPGETLRVKDLFFTGLAGSANNAINALVRSTGLSRPEFVKLMNEKAKAWGLTQTKFVDVTGLDPANVTTTSEYAILATRALKDFRILQATTAKEYSFTTINTGKAHTIVNKNKLIGSPWYITGMKTGYLEEAGYCLMVKARKSKYASPDIITVILGSATDQQRYKETNDLINYALSLY